VPRRSIIWPTGVSPVRVTASGPGSRLPVSSEISALKRSVKPRKRSKSTGRSITRSLPRRKWNTVRYRASRARQIWAKATVRLTIWRCSRNRSGVWDVACGDGQRMNWGGPPIPDRGAIPGGSRSWHKAPAENHARIEGVGVGHSTDDGRDNTPRSEGRSPTLVRWALTETGRA
jgi:hypothetical protein